MHLCEAWDLTSAAPHAARGGYMKASEGKSHSVQPCMVERWLSMLVKLSRCQGFCLREDANLGSGLHI